MKNTEIIELLSELVEIPSISSLEENQKDVLFENLFSILKDIDTEIKDLIRKSVKQALDSPLSPITNLEEDSYA